MLTGYTWCIPIADKSEETIVKAYIKEVYSKYGGSRKILSDNVTEFKNKLFDQVAQDLGIEHKVYSQQYHPASNGMIERFHSFLKACLAKHISTSFEWDEMAHIACSVYNFLLNEHSREFGRDPRILLNDLLRPRIRYLGTDKTIECTACEILKAKRVLNTRLMKLIGVLYLNLGRVRWYKWSCASS